MRRRGRRPDSAKQQRPHAVDAIKAAYILSRRSAPPVQYCEKRRVFDFLRGATTEVGEEEEYNPQTSQVDLYPLFVRTLAVFAGCRCAADNHGLFCSVSCSA